VTRKLVLIGGICVPGPRSILELRDEVASEDQGLSSSAFYPTENCLVKMLYGAGFRVVYRFTVLPEHEDYRAALFSKKVRTMLAASKVPLTSTFLCPVPEPQNSPNPWATRWAKTWNQPLRLWRLICKPWPEKLATIRRHILQMDNISRRRTVRKGRT